jgi:hypothetical protein
VLSECTKNVYNTSDFYIMISHDNWNQITCKLKITILFHLVLKRERMLKKKLNTWEEVTRLCRNYSNDTKGTWIQCLVLHWRNQEPPSISVNYYCIQSDISLTSNQTELESASNKTRASKSRQQSKFQILTHDVANLTNQLIYQADHVTIDQTLAIPSSKELLDNM